MSRETVRTVPPWVIQRPPLTRRPQRNHDLSETSQRSAASDSPQHNGNGKEVAVDAKSDDGLSIPTTERAAATTATADATPTAPPTPPKTSPRESPTSGTQGSGTDVDGAPSPEGGNPGDTSSGGMVSRFTHLFMSKEGRKWDHLRSAEPVIVPQFHVPKGFMHRQDRSRDQLGSAPGRRTAAATSSSAAVERTPWWYNPESQWHTFIESTRYPHLSQEKSEVVNDEEMQRLNLFDFGYHTALRAKAGGGDGGGGVGHFHHRLHVPENMADKSLWERIVRLLLHHPLVPLACRLTVLMTSIVALAVAVQIYRHERLGTVGEIGGISTSDAPERTQVIVAIVVDVVAVPYIGYITVDDYTGKPLGLRPPKDRIRLILTDLFFIIFKSASTALGFEAMIFVSTAGSAGLLRTLGVFELIGLVSWALTLTINVFREIERLGG